MCAIALCQQIGKDRQIVVALDQRRPAPDPIDQRLVQLPDFRRHWHGVRVDEQRDFIAGIWCVSSQMNFLDGRSGERRQVFRCIEAEIVRADIRVVDVDEKSAPCSADELRQKLRFGPFVARKLDVQRGILNKNAPTERGLHDVDVARNPIERRARSRKREQVGKRHAFEAPALVESRAPRSLRGQGVAWRGSRAHV